jgi:hypothetical protein
VRRQALSLFLLVFFAHGFFASALGFNQAARVGAILTFVEPGPDRFTLRIDEFVRSDARNLQTGDWALGADGHFYSNKAPGASLLGIPVYAALYGVERLLGIDYGAERVTRVNAYLLNLGGSVAWSAAATALFFAFLAASGFARSEALLGALAWAFGTLVFPYDTSLWGHATASACVLLALCLVWWPGGVRRPALAGALAGLAVLVEYLALLPVLAIGAGWLAQPLRLRGRIAFALGALVPLLVLLLYQYAAFEDLFATATSQGNPDFREPGRTFGVLGAVSSAALFGLLFSSWRGLFLYCPVLLFACAGAWQAWRAGRRALVAACLAAFAASVLFVASFNAWPGGMASGPRYLIVAIPLLAVLAPRANALGRGVRALYGAALAVSACNMLALAAVELMIDEADRNPLYGFAYRKLLSGEYPALPDATNLGQQLGLAPPFDLAAFGLVVGLWLSSLWRSTRAADRPS